MKKKAEKTFRVCIADALGVENLRELFGTDDEKS